MGDSITAMKKQMEKYEKEMERVDNQTKQRNIDVDRRFDEVMDKLNHMPKMMVAYNWSVSNIVYWTPLIYIC